MEKYQLGKVYAIICRKTGRRYVGSTCEPTLARRLSKHVSDFNYWLKNGKGYRTSFDIIKDKDYYIVLLESYPCNSRDELRMCEQKHIDVCERVNKIKAFSEQELVEYNKQYREQNYDKIIAKKRERVLCPHCQKDGSRGNLAQHIKICKKNLTLIHEPANFETSQKNRC